MNPQQGARIAVVGGGIAGAACARSLSRAGHAVEVFDKSRGPGGRLATRRLEWTDDAGRSCTTRLDHGALQLTARSGAFGAFVADGVREGWLTEWRPTPAAGSLPLEDDGPRYLPAPEGPAVCRALLSGIAAHWSFAVDGLYQGPRGWQLLSGGEPHAAIFDAVVLALPPAQAAPLLGPHRHDWARHAALAPMDPCWTLMGISDEPAPAVDWDIARPPAGPLAWVLRSDARPGRERLPGRASWVLHARANWSRRHLERPATWVQQQMQAALTEWLGRSVDWQHCVTHRWRYALPSARNAPTAPSCWWDDVLGLGVCGDFLGGTGVEGAWLSGEALAREIADPIHRSDRAEPATRPPALAAMRQFAA